MQGKAWESLEGRFERGAEDILWGGELLGGLSMRFLLSDISSHVGLLDVKFTSGIWEC